MRKFFNKFFYISFIMILLGLIIQLELNVYRVDSVYITYFLDILGKLLENGGIALFIANIFTFIIGTEDFLDYIRQKLMKVVVSKEFITTLSIPEQQKLLKLTLKPSKDLSELYSGIDDYFNDYIDSSMKLFENSYRGNLVINAYASYNSELSKIQMDIDMDYTVYKTSEKFESIKFYFEDDDSKHVSTTIYAKNTNPEVLTDQDARALDPSEISTSSVTKGFEIKVPDHFHEFQQININRKFIEYGNDHWQVFSYRTIYPYHGIIIHIKCAENLQIKHYLTYGKQQDFSVEQINNTIKIQNHNWMNPGFGANVVIALDNYHECPITNPNNHSIISCYIHANSASSEV